jgi:PIN domain nuclease of toxin-antitoxin system
MRILLDTHIWLWGLYDASRIRKRLAQELRNPKNELWLSPISTWEALLLQEKGRLWFLGSAQDWISEAVAPFREAPLTHEIAMEARAVVLAHRDPADRFIAATAKVLGLTLATADTKLLGLGDIATLANR